MLSAYASLVRIQDFLALEEKRDISLETEAQSDLLYAGNEGSSSTLQLKDASFSWLPDSETVLKEVNLALKLGSLHMLVGPVASVGFTCGHICIGPVVDYRFGLRESLHCYCQCWGKQPL